MLRNQEIAQIFEDVANLLEIRGDNIHRVLSYRRAGENIRALGQELADIRAAGGLTGISGIGKTLAEKIEEMLDTGQLEFYERVAAEVPSSLLELMKVDGLGPKRIKLVYEQLSITTLDELEAAAQAGKLQDLPKMGKKSEEKILKSITMLRQHGDDRYPLGEALPLAEQILKALQTVAGVKKTAVAGSTRRRRETIGDLDLLVAADDAEAVMQTFCELPLADKVALRGPTKSRIILPNGLGVDLRVLPEENWGTLLSYFTGSQAHNVRLRELAQKKGLSLNEYSFTKMETGEDILCASEEEVYAVLDLPYIPPTLRENRGEIEAARNGQLPELITQEAIVSDLHMHTTWSDGKMTILEMAQAAQARGLKYIVITDHSASLGIANGLSIKRLREQAAEITAANEQMGSDFRILHGTEMEIKADGSLDFPDEVLAGLDFVIASLHVSLNQSQEQVTERMLNAIRNPHVDMIAHPTGRLLPSRPGADLDMEQIFTAAAEHDTILEINANPRRLDLRDTHIRRAKELHMKLAINTDAHHVDHFELLPYGIATAQRGWVTAADVVNTWPLTKLVDFLAKRSAA
ncbi:MAG: DNA polymerase/3'-5' exonuclease PolX [Anaerolineales bacterium]|nr:DNA polymerase/3'-5' exonuclease PolX [Anaerolineales bacterium]